MGDSPKMPASTDWHDLPRFPFGDGPELADQLLDLILTGRKRATCWRAEEGTKGTVVAGRWVVEDSKGRPRAVLETTGLHAERFKSIDEDFAAAEGEGDLSLSYWRDAHQAYFTRSGVFDPEMLLWCERFELIAIVPTSD